MTRTYQRILIVLSIAALVASFFGWSTVKATLAVFTPTTCYTAAATSTLAFMTPGTATATTGTCNLGPDGASSATVLAIVNASSTATTLSFNAEESMDGQDWYPVSMNQSASTTSQFNLSTRGSLLYTFASSTIGGTASGASLNSLGVAQGGHNRNHVSFNVPVRMRYIRVYAGVATTTGALPLNGAVWMQIVPRQEIN